MQRVDVTEIDEILCRLMCAYREAVEPKPFCLCVNTALQVKSLSLTLCSL